MIRHGNGVTRRLGRNVAIVACLLLITSLSAVGKPLRLDPTKEMNRYVLSTWRETTGLPVDSVAALAQTPDGYLWLGTELGLVRFDGVRFAIFNKGNTPALLRNEVSSLFVSSDGALWIGTHGGGAVRHHAGRFERVGEPVRLIEGLAESGDGAVWVAGPSMVARVHRGQTTRFGKKEGYPGGRLSSAAADATGAYFGLHDSVVRLDPSGVRVWSAKEGVSGGGVSALLMTPGGLLAGTHSGTILRLARDASRFEPFLPSLGHGVSSIIEGDRGSLWLGTHGGGVLRWFHGEVSAFTEKDGLTSGSVNQLFEDDEANVWVATVGGGLLRLKEGRLSTVDPRLPLTGDWILPLAQARDGSIFFATNGGGLNHLDGDRLTRLTTADGLLSNMISAVAAHRDGSIWIGTDAGVQRLEGDRITRTLTEKEGLPGPRVLAITPARDDSVWVSTLAGLFRIRGEKVQKLTSKDGLADGHIISIREAADGSLWFGKMGAIEHFVDGKLTSYSREDGLWSHSIFSISIDEKDGSIWAATAGDGLARVKDGKVRMYRAADGLLSDVAYTVLQDRGGNLWVSTNLGLYTIKRSALDRFDAGLGERLPITAFRKADGLKTSDFSGGFDLAGFRAYDGKLWFPTTRGLVAIDPAAIRTATNAPRVIVESLVANGAPHPLGSEIDLPRGHRQIEIAYTSPSFHSPETTSFRYRLDGFDEDWQDAGARRTAYYTNLPPGSYLFRVEAVNGEGLSRQTSVPIRIKPQWQETWLFRSTLVLTALLAVLVLLRRRNDAIRERQADLRRSEEHFRELTENGSDMILVVNSNGGITYVSPSVTRALGADSEEIEGKHVNDLLADGCAIQFLDSVRRKGRAAATFPFVNAHGQRRQLEAIGTCAGTRIIVNCRDITERRQLEAQLEQAHRVASLGRLAATVAHEFNNVLMGIQPFVEIIQRSSQDRAVVKATGHMNQSIRRGKRITEEILGYTRPAEPVLKPVPVRDWLGGLETEIRALVGPSVRVGLLAPEGLSVQADVSQLSQVITNLALNARDAGATSLRIDVHRTEGDGVFPFGVVREPGRHAHLSVTDNGSGIPDSILPHIFEPLFTTKTSSGTGLGLAVAQKVVSRHGGEMFVESRVGIGTTFHLFLPLALSAVEQYEESDSNAAAPACRVLLVEDDPAVGEGILMMLESHGFQSRLAVTAAEALNVMPRFSPDVVVLDVGLPDMDGTELYRRLVAKWPHTRVIFSTGHADVTPLQEVVGSTPTCLLKPYTFDALVAAIAEKMEKVAAA